MTSILILQIFPLICIGIVMVFLCIQNMRTRRFMSVLFLLAVGTVFVLALFLALERYGVDIKNRVLATVMCFLGYAIRPVLIYPFILLTTRRFGRFEKLLLIPLGLNAVIYSASLFFDFDPLGHLVFYYGYQDGVFQHIRGGPLNFTSHFVSFAYLLTLVTLCLRNLRGKHRYDSASVLVCAVAIVAAVILEMADLAPGVLNVAIMISVVVYYLFLLQEENRRDALTGLFNRKTFYHDLTRFASSITGAIQVDMNGLKALNDNEGHEKGDAAIASISRSLEEKTSKRMYIYRVGGDEFTILSVGDTQESLSRTIESIKEDVAFKGYSVSVGFAYRTEKRISLDELLREADQAMYADKAAYYASHPGLNRRQRPSE